jgi:dTDP-4-dehydrorhamnose reductase
MKRILIVGASGLLGTKLYEIAKDKYEVFGTYHSHEMKGETFFKLDVTSRKEVFSLFEKLKPNVVFDFHSITDVDYCELHPEEAWLVNVDGTKNIAEASKTFGAKMFFISSDYVFDGKKTNYSEKDKPNPLNFYGKTKAVAEKVVEFLVPDFIIARTAVLYGLGGLGKKPFPLWVLENLKEGKEIKVVIDQFNNPTLADNLAEILLKLYEKNASGLFHVVGKDNVSRYEFAMKVAEIFGINKNLIKPITSPELRQAALRTRKLELSTRKLQRILDIVPVGIEEGLKIIKKQMEEKQ